MKIYEKEGFELNPNKKIRNAILKGVARNEGKCPCVHTEECTDEDLICPCKNYRENDICCCKLYTKIK